MIDDPTFRIRVRRTSWKSLDLIYQEPGHDLVLYLEASGVPDFDWVGATAAFETWTDPAGEPIPSGKRKEIRERVAGWAEGNRLRVDFGPTLDRDGHLEMMRDAGWSIERHPDGIDSAAPPTDPE